MIDTSGYSIDSLYTFAINTETLMKDKTGDDYFALQTDLNFILRDMLRKNFALLSKPRVFKFLALCSTHRPMEPHGVLTQISIRYEENYKI